LNDFAAAHYCGFNRGAAEIDADGKDWCHCLGLLGA
jgi:hypothetical protein